jgi:hypothetical protein
MALDANLHIVSSLTLLTTRTLHENATRRPRMRARHAPAYALLLHV